MIPSRVNEASDFDDEAVEALDTVSVKSYSGHTDDVSCCCFSSTWELLVTGANDSTLCVWDIEKKSVLHSFHGHREQLKCVTFSPDDHWIASGGYDRDVLVWDVKSGMCLFRLVQHESCVECVSFSPSGTLLCSGSWDYSAALWDVKVGILLRVVKHHESVVQCSAFSMSGNLLATASWDYTIHVYEVLYDAMSQDQANNDIHVLKDEKESLFVNKLSNMKLITDEPKIVDTLSSREYVHRTMSSYHNQGRLGETVSAERMKTLVSHCSNIKCVAFSCNDLLASASWDCTLCLWNAQTGVRLHVLYGHEGFVQTCTFSPNGSYVASAADDETVRIWSVKDGALVKTLDAYAEEIHQLAFTEFGTLLLSGPEHLELCLY